MRNVFNKELEIKFRKYAFLIITLLSVNQALAGDVVLWAKNLFSATSQNIQSANNICVTNDGSCIIVENVWGTKKIRKTEGQDVTIQSRGVTDLFIACYKPNNYLNWVYQIGGSKVEIFSTINAMHDNTFIIAGGYAYPNIIPMASNNNPDSDDGAIILNHNGLSTITLVPADFFDKSFFMAKYNTNGSICWSKREGLGGVIWYNNLTPLYDNSFIAAGSYTPKDTYLNQVTFGMDDSTSKTFSSGTGEQAILAKYAQDGELVWARHSSTLINDYVFGLRFCDLCALPDNSCLVVGQSAYPNFVLNLDEVDATTHTSSCESIITFIVKYKTDGKLDWIKELIWNSCNVLDINIGLDGSIYLLSLFKNPIIVSPGNNPLNINKSNNQYNILLIKLKSNGLVEWVKRIGDEKIAEAFNVCGLADGNCMISGFVAGPVTFGPGEPNETNYNSTETTSFIAKYRNDGKLIWVHFAEMLEGYSRGQNLAVAPDQSYMFYGGFQGIIRFGKGELHESTLYSQSQWDNYLVRFSPPFNRIDSWQDYN